MTRQKVRYEQSSTKDGMEQKQSLPTAKISFSILLINLVASHNLSSIRSLAELLTMVMMIWDATRGKKYYLMATVT